MQMRKQWLIALLFALINLRSIICCNLCRLSSLQTSKLHFRPYGIHTGIPKNVKISRITESQPQLPLLPLHLNRRISKATETNSSRGAFFSDKLSATDESQTKIKEVLISWIRWYRNTLSPIMPPNCRFLPSCSNYAMQAIAEHGSYRWDCLFLIKFLLNYRAFRSEMTETIAIHRQFVSQRLDIDNMANITV